MESKWNLDLEKSFLNIYSFLVGFSFLFTFPLLRLSLEMNTERFHPRK